MLKGWATLFLYKVSWTFLNWGILRMDIKFVDTFNAIKNFNHGKIFQMAF